MNGCLYKRKDSPYCWIKYIDADGKQVAQSTKSKVKIRAQYILAERIKEVEDGRFGVTKCCTLAEVATAYRKWAANQKWKGKDGQITLLIERFGADTPFDELDIRKLETYQTELLASGLTPATVNRRFAVLKHMATKATDWNMAPERVTVTLHRIKVLSEKAQERLRYFTLDEISTLLEACNAPKNKFQPKRIRNPYLREIVALALNTGLRRGEILSLTWAKVDLAHGYLRIERTKTDEPRNIPINDTLREVLDYMFANNPEESLYVFHERGTGLPFNSISSSWENAIKTAKITDFRFHDLRHTFASHLAMQGIPLLIIKELLGHKDIKMTLRYAHLMPGQTQDAVKRLRFSYDNKKEVTDKSVTS